LRKTEVAVSGSEVRSVHRKVHVAVSRFREMKLSIYSETRDSQRKLLD